MRECLRISAAQALQQWDDYAPIIDVRTSAEYELDHLEPTVNHPVLDNDQRVHIGTLHQSDKFEARRQGAALVARNIAAMLEGPLQSLNPKARVLVYCWRGGNRSGALATILSRVGWHTTVIDGGYKSLRAELVLDLPRLVERLRFCVIAGRTGVGKSQLLQALQAKGAQVLDLEALAQHRGSLLGAQPGAQQPSQKRFESLIWGQLRRFDPAMPVFVESESRKVGAVQVPESLIHAMRQSACVLIDAPVQVRTALLLNEYTQFLDAPQALAALLQPLVSLHGHERINTWRTLIEKGQWPDLVQCLLLEHYDPSYDRSMKRNYQRIDHAPIFTRQGADSGALEALTHQIVETAGRL